MLDVLNKEVLEEAVYNLEDLTTLSDIAEQGYTKVAEEEFRKALNKAGLTDKLVRLAEMKYYRRELQGRRYILTKTHDGKGNKISVVVDMSKGDVVLIKDKHNVTLLVDTIITNAYKMDKKYPLPLTNREGISKVGLDCIGGIGNYTRLSKNGAYGVNIPYTKTRDSIKVHIIVALFGHDLTTVAQCVGYGYTHVIHHELNESRISKEQYNSIFNLEVKEKGQHDRLHNYYRSRGLYA